MAYRKRHAAWTAAGVAALETLTWTAAARLDDQVQDEWEAEAAAEEQERADKAERRRLNLVEQRLRVQDRIERLRRRQARRAGGTT